ncbi:recombinase RecT [Rhodococcoides fascians]|uniref:recombinase RecT n=1 Tax=Rhodococcoides fascians TaxID=1828 RepID=UPI00068AA5D9|nr:recombinase RecT [Rhodococcus fascians]
MSNDVAVQETKTDLAIKSNQDGFTDKQIAMLQQLGIEDATAGDIDLFFHRCKVTGLDPFSRQIYMIGRRTTVKVWNEQTRKQEDKWVMKYTIQTGIDGYRLNGARAARKRNDVVAIGSPMWRGRDSDWDDVWLDPSTPPAAARFTIVKNGESFTATAMYHEYVQTNKDGSPNAMWKKMPSNQLAKCAEAACWRKAYPDDFSDLVLEDAAQVIDEEGNRVTVESERVGNGAKNVKAAMGLTQRQEPINITDTHTEVEKEPVQRTTERTKNSTTSAKPQASASNSGAKVDSATDPGDAPATSGQIGALGKLFKKEGYDDWPSQLQWLQGNGIVHGEISGLGDLNGAQAAVGIEALQ